ncbi:MAG TPA: ArsB/NhaD family transporter [Candidatus Poseidoniaceae archaeon]|nr:ArsB/NhaD family transporter [Candidatus Poseidoniaceae archaeon]
MGHPALASRRTGRRIALLTLLGVGALMFIGQGMAAGSGGGTNDMHLEIHIKAGLESQALLVGGLILLAVYAMIITEVVERTLAAALGGLAAVLALNYYSEEAALSLKAVTTMIDWETIGLLLGMMVMVGILSNTGVFEWFAVEAYKRSGGDVWTLTVILCLVTAVLSAFLDNVTTMLLLTPVTIQLARVLDLRPIPLLIAEVLFSNIGGAATMIGDPPNIMIGSALSPDAISKNPDPALAALADSGVTFNDFIIEMGPAILMCIVPGLMMIRWLFREELSGVRHRDVAELEHRYGIKDPRGLKISGGILVIVILAFFLHPIFHIPVSWIALVGGVVMLTATNPHEIEEPLHHVEWTTLLFFAGLFVLVHSLEYLGLIGWIGEQVTQAIGSFNEDMMLPAAIVIILWVSAIASAFIDNIPYTATMIPVVLAMCAELSLPLEPIIWALAFGACLGGNGTLIGASANVVTAGLSKEAGYPISFNEFFRAGFPVMIVTTFIAMIYCLLVYVVGADNPNLWKLVLLLLTAFSLIWQFSKGMSSGLTPIESLGDHGLDDVIEGAKNLKNSILGVEEE